jgi:uncharacterized RmlC-like cupin family protein
MATRTGKDSVLIHSGATYQGKQGIEYGSGITAESAGSRALCMNLLDLPPGARAKPHLHEAHETAIYVINRAGDMLYGDGLRERMTFGPGDFIFIPAGEPHVPINTSNTEHLIAVVARTDANEQESVVLLPELDDRVQVADA